MAAWFSIFLVRAANWSAEVVSSALSCAGDALHSITVTELPPSEFCSSRVSFESRYGTWLRFAPSVSAEMTLPSAVSERLIAAPSLRRPPSAFVDF